MKNNQKFVLYLGGGAMRGVFCAGVASRLEELNLYDKIEAVYGESCGSINGAYFVAKQANFGAPIYYDDLHDDNFLRIKNIPIAMYQIVKKRIFKSKTTNIRDVLDIPFLFDIIKNKKILDLEKLKNQPIPFYIKLLNLKDCSIEYIDVPKAKDPLRALSASVLVAPYSSLSENINGNEYIDGGLAQHIPVEDLKRRHPGCKIVFVFNAYPKFRIEQYVYDFLEGVFSAMLHGLKIFKIFLFQQHDFLGSVQLVSKDKDVLLIYPPDDSPVTVATTNRDELIEVYNMGRDYAQKVVDFIHPDRD